MEFDLAEMQKINTVNTHVSLMFNGILVLYGGR